MLQKALEPAKSAYTNKTREFVTSKKQGTFGFKGITKIVFNKSKSSEKLSHFFVVRKIFEIFVNERLFENPMKCIFHNLLILPAKMW